MKCNGGGRKDAEKGEEGKYDEGEGMVAGTGRLARDEKEGRAWVVAA